MVSYLSLIDIPDFRSAIRDFERVLWPGGRLVVANLGFVTASDGWPCYDAGTRLHHRVDRYADWYRVPLFNVMRWQK